MNHSLYVTSITSVQGSTWFERLLMNLLSYSLILVPIAVTVITVRYRVCPNAFHNNTLLQRFVYGCVSGNNQDTLVDAGSREDVAKLLPNGNERARTIRHSTLNTWKPGNTLIFIWCLFGLQLSYLIWGLLQEKIMTTEYPITSREDLHLKDLDLGESTSNSSLTSESYITFHDSQFLVFFNRVLAFITAIVGLIFIHIKNYRLRRQVYHSSSKYIASSIISNKSDSRESAPLYKFIYCSLSNILSSWCQYEALKYVNFPTQCLSKSCKIIPVMLMSRVLLRRRYKIIDYLCAIMLALGTFIFILNQKVPDSSGPSIGSGYQASNPNRIKLNESVILQHESKLDTGLNLGDGNLLSTLHSNKNTTLISGMILLALYLTFDSFTSNWQQNLYDNYSISNWQMMAAINFYSILLTLTSLHQLGDLAPAIRLLASSKSLLYDCILMSIMSSIGQMFVYFTIKRFGPVVFAVIMTLRQFLSILLSCFTYSHPMNLGSMIGMMIVFLVAGYQIWHKHKTRPCKRSNDNSRDDKPGNINIEFQRREIRQS